MDAVIAALFVYPVKSCRAVALSATTITERGLARDREWMIVDAAGRFVSQREQPRLALIRPALSRAALELMAPAMEPIAIPLERTGARRSVTVWSDTPAALDQGDEPAVWLSAWLGHEVRLVRFDPAARRLCNPVHAGDSGAHTAFADGYPLLVLSEASLADLNRRLASPLPVDRFRPNILLAGMPAYDEDHIDELVTGAVTLMPVKPCIRCRITTTDQETGQVGVEPLPTLAGYRMDTALGGVAFGVNAIVASGAGATIAVGAAARYTLRF
jgi:uncharacterized protein YcbX